MEENNNLPGVRMSSFELVLTEEMHVNDVLNENFIVLSPPKIREYSLDELGTRPHYITKVEVLDIFLHNQFLYKYSPFMWFGMKIK